MTTKLKQIEHISYSAIKDWDTCPKYFKIVRIEEIDGFKGNIHTAFGNGVHHTNEAIIEGKISLEEQEKFFKQSFAKYYRVLSKEEKTKLKTDPSVRKLYKDMLSQGARIVKESIPALNKYFGKYEVISVEEPIQEAIKEYEYAPFSFKGYIDLVIKTEKGKYIILDWKTCSWGWNQRKKADPMVIYQLILYKHFFAQKHNIPLKDIDVLFALLKRTPSNKEETCVEFVSATSGPKRIKNALNLVTNTVYNIDHHNFIKKKTSCEKCKFNFTKHCPK